MTAKADAAAHGKSLHERDNRLGVAENFSVQPVLVSPEFPAIVIVACLTRRIKLGNVAAGTERALARCIDYDQINRCIVRPPVERIFDGKTHVVGQRIQGLRAVKGNTSGAPGYADRDIAHLFFNMSRATMTRMISFVPSNIWCTRRSRTSFSMP